MLLHDMQRNYCSLLRNIMTQDISIDLTYKKSKKESRAIIRDSCIISIIVLCKYIAIFPP